MGQSSNRETLRFTLELLRRIPRSRRITVAGGTVRTERAVRMQLELLVEMGEIERDDARPFGYRRVAKARGFDAAQMTEQESLLLMLAQKLLASLLPPSLTQSLDGFFEQARRELDPFGDDTLAKQWLAKVHVSNDLPTLIPPKIGEGVLETASHALYLNLPLTLDYRHSDGRESRNRVKPLGLVQQGPRLYLVCAGEGLPKPVYPFALHRMLKVKVGKTPFERPADFDLARFDREGGISYAKGTNVRASFRLTRQAGQHVIESPLASDQRHVVEGSHIRFTATYPDSLRLDRWLWSFGPDISEVCKEPLAVVTESVS